MTQFWLIPVDEPSYQATLAQPVDLSDAPTKPAAFPDRTRVWGVRTDPEQGYGEDSRNREYLEQMNVGDPFLLYRNRESTYTAAGRIGPFWKTTYVRDEFWNGGPALDVFAIEDYTEIEVSTDEVNDVLGYEENVHPQGLWRVADDRPVEQLLRRMDS